MRLALHRALPKLAGIPVRRSGTRRSRCARLGWLRAEQAEEGKAVPRASGNLLSDGRKAPEALPPIVEASAKTVATYSRPLYSRRRTVPGCGRRGSRSRPDRLWRGRDSVTAAFGSGFFRRWSFATAW